MAKINNKSKYPFDINLSLDDFLIGSDANNADFTRNYKLSGLFSTFKTALNLASIEFTFSDGVTDPSLDENDAGFFTTNSTSAPAVTEIIINKTDFSGVDITSLLEVVDDQPTSFVLRVFKASVTGQVFYFAISAITDNLDNTYTLTVDNFVGGNILQDGTTYSFVFDLAGVPSIYSETDPIFLASPAGGILAGDITNWNTAFGWGNHASAGYLTTVAIGDVTGFTDNSTNWNTAFGWGNHALAGYLTSYTETDPVFTASPAFGITTPNIGTWNLAYTWGDHAVAGYLTSESDPVFTASAAFGITGTLITSWNSAYEWGDHEAVGYLVSSDIDTLAELNAIVADATLIDTTDFRLSDARTPTAHTHTFASLTSKPTTISGYGITDAYTKAENDASYLKLTGGTVTGTTAFTGSSTLRVYGNNTGIANVGFISFYESNGTVRQGYVGLPTASNGNMYLSSDVAGTQFILEENGGIDGLRYYDGAGTGIIWHSRNDGASSTLDAGLFHGHGRSASGDRWTKTPVVESSGVMEIGRYIDFHNTATDGTDNTFRIDNGTAGTLDLQGAVIRDALSSSSIITAATGFNLSSGQYSTYAGDNRVKFSVWSTSTYGIGMGNSYTYGSLNGYAMTFQMNNTGGRGWWWGTSTDTNAQGSMSLTVAGQLTLKNTVTATDFIATSDRRLKTNIETLKGDPLKLRWVEFNRIADGEYQLGLIAQEVEKVNPEFVITDKEGYKSVKYISVFVAKMAEKDREIEDLTTRIERLELIVKDLL